MENLALNMLPILQSNTVTLGLGLGTVSEVYYRGVEKNIGALMKNGFSAALLGLATAYGLPELGIYTSPELVTYAAMIGFNLPTLISVAAGAERMGGTSLPMGLAGAAIGLVADASGVGISANKLIKMVGNGIQYFRNLKIR
ncbi:MAG: hypothetical protein WA061_03260 [Microgenomates group bacterium]